MTKGTRKTKRRLKKTVRKTLGTLFLISAIVVAAIPTEGLRAEGEISTQATGHNHATTHSGADYKVSVRRTQQDKSNDLLAGSSAPVMEDLIPTVPSTATIYTTGTLDDGSSYQFAYMNNGDDWFAILLGYNKENNLPNNTLTIPNTVSAYIQPTGNLGTGNGYVAASQSGEPLYYESLTAHTRTVTSTTEYEKDSEGKIVMDGSGNPVYAKETQTYYTGEIIPCYATDNNWKSLNLDEFFYANSGSTVTSTKAEASVSETPGGAMAQYSGYARTTEPNHQWIKNGAVKYIGNQYLNSEYNAATLTYKWSIPSDNGNNYITAATASKGIFAGAGNIGTLNIGDNLIGVGNYAFYECSGLNSISFGNGLRVIGNWAFAACGSMANVAVPAISNLTTIGDHAFYRCNQLTDMTIPISVQYIGDYAFAECRFLSNVELCNSGSGVSSSNLKELGWNVFENCETLYSLTFPDNYAETVDISLVKGCKNLHFITVRNPYQTFTEETGDDTSKVYCFDCFKDMLSGEPVYGTFYFEGRSDGAIHTFTQDNCFAFSYINYNAESKQYENQNKYELTVQDPDHDGETGRSTYVVNSSNELISSTVGDAVESLQIPDPIGPYHIYNIGANIFANNCNLKLVSLPASVQSIGDGAFRGCHNLATVVFNNDSVVIGTDAFKTQDYTGGSHKCSTGVENDPTDNSPKVKLRFVGNISSDSTPYQYAMSYSGRYNNSSQVESFVTFCSGWPSNLVVQYNKDKGVSELVDFPAFSELSNYKTDTTSYPYLTTAQRNAAGTALEKYSKGEPMTEDEQSFINSAMNIVIPEGIQAIKDKLFVEKENADANVLKEDKTLSIYGLDTIEEDDFQGAERLSSVAIYGNTAAIAKNAFKGCKNLADVAVNGTTSSIGDYAFSNCDALNNVTLSASVSGLGLIPFKGCKNLSNVDFQGTDYFTCDNSIIYGMEGTAKARLIECLEGRNSKYVKASETSGITSIAPHAFDGCENIREVDLTDSAISAVPTYAFANTTGLRTVKLPSSCTSIEDFAFSGSSMDRLEASQYLTLLGQNAFDGLTLSHSEVVLCSPEDSYLYKYGQLNGFAVDTVPEVNYYTVIFRDWNEELGKYVEVTDYEQRVKGGEDATPPTPAGKTGETFQYWDPDYREISGDTVCVAIYSKDDPDANKLTVTFQDWDGTVVKEIKVASGGSIDDSDLPNTSNLVRDGYVFIGWDRPLTNITESFTTMAVYKALSEDDIVIRYINSVTKEVFYQTTIKKGSVAPSILIPEVSGYTFREWLPDLSQPVSEETDFYALYDAVGESPSPSTSADPTTSPTTEPTTVPSTVPSSAPSTAPTTAPSASPSTSPSSSPSASPNNNNNNSGNNTNNTKMYTLTVKNGSGSGSYVAGAQPIIIANDPAANQQFSNWSIDPANTTIASKVLSATVITMPAGNVTVTANYTAKSNSGTSASTVSGNSASSNSNRRPSSTTTGNLSGGRTTVVIDKNGLSNTGVVSATVNGSSDNFVIKVSESASASEEVVKALMAEYGNDISSIKYFPMDISLYDSTGNTKITDTTGLSVSITLPLPDSLITYAGNNKVGGVVNSRLDKLTPKFSTISGVSCITFTAEHFSPYVIYVDTNNLTAGTVADSTPKTGDGIHPKWFLSMGLACMSVVLFMKKDKKSLRRARA